MKRTIKLGLLILVVMMFFGCAGSSSFMAKQTTPPPAGPSPGKALIYFMRPSGMGFAIHFQIYHDRKLIGLSQAKSYFAYECDPGTHMFLGLAENKLGLKAELEAGKTYYVITQVRMGGWKARMGLIPVTPGSQWWNLMETYKTKLIYNAANQAALEAFQAQRASKIASALDETYSFLETPQGKPYVVHLNPADGR